MSKLPVEPSKHPRPLPVLEATGIPSSSSAERLGTKSFGQRRTSHLGGLWVLSAVLLSALLAGCGQVQLGSYGDDAGIQSGGASSTGGSMGGGRGPGGSSAGQSSGGESAGEKPPSTGGFSAGASPSIGGAAGEAGSSTDVSSAGSEGIALDAGPDADATPPLHANAPPSCSRAVVGCGEGGDSCCSTLFVPGGLVSLKVMSSPVEPRVPVRVSSFYLDKYEVTIGRFQEFLASYEGWLGLGNPEVGAGSHPRIVGSGWQEAYAEHLPASAALFEERLLECSSVPFSTWTTPSGTNQVPLNCVSWFEASAFCAWDEGRLPTFAEWAYAAVGGAEERTYPWGNDVPSRSHAMYGCTLGDFMTTCRLSDVLPVGSHPLGAGFYGQHDLSGSMSEWTLDDSRLTFTEGCTDCASLSDDPMRMWRGGSFGDRADGLENASFSSMNRASRLQYVGLRCARDTGL